MTTQMKEKLTEAINAKNNDVNSFVWKLARNEQGVQEEIKLIDATPEQLNKFYNHCISMLYSKDKVNPGRYTVLDIIKEQREKCDTELFLRKLESGAILPDGTKYPRYLYRQDIRDYMNKHRDKFPASELKNIPITNIQSNVPAEFQRISISSVLDGSMDNLGTFSNKHITFSFILHLGVYFTQEELKELSERDAEGNLRSKMEVVKERLKIPSNVRLIFKPTGLTYSELRSMINLKSDKYSKLTTEQINTLRKKIFFLLEQEIDFHIQMWERKMYELETICKKKGIELTINDVA